MKMRMKRAIKMGCLFCVCLLMLPMIALGEEELPGDIQEYFQSSAFIGWTIADQAFFDASGAEDCWFVLLRTAKDENVLYAFAQKGGVYKERFHTADAVPQGENAVDIDVRYSFSDDQTGATYNKPVLCIYQFDSACEYAQTSVYYYLQNGAWLLTRVKSYVPNCSIVLEDGRISYFDDIESTNISGTAYGTVQRDIRYVSLSALPKTPAQAKAKLTNAPKIPSSAELKAKDIEFKGGKKYAVYAAPGLTSVRCGNGKAAVSTNGWIQVFGEENGWLLIQYSIDSEHYRFGYINADSLPKNAGVNALQLTAQSAWTVGAVSVTDDPLYSQAAFAALPANSWVMLLARMGNWAYIESSTGDFFRGFVPLDAVTTSRVFDLLNCPAPSGAEVYRGQLTIGPDNAVQIEAQIAVDGPLASVPVGAIHVYDSVSGTLIITAEKNEQTQFVGHGVMPRGASSVRIVAVDESGREIAAPVVTIEW